MTQSIRWLQSRRKHQRQPLYLTGNSFTISFQFLSDLYQSSSQGRASFFSRLAFKFLLLLKALDLSPPPSSACLRACTLFVHKFSSSSSLFTAICPSSYPPPPTEFIVPLVRWTMIVDLLMRVVSPYPTPSFLPYGDVPDGCISKCNSRR